MTHNCRIQQEHSGALRWTKVAAGLTLTLGALGLTALPALAAGTTYDEEVARFAHDFRIAARCFGDTRDVGALVAWLCSQFAGYLTGQSIVIDGGATRSTF